MARQNIEGTDTVKDALKTKANANFTENYADISTNETDIATNTADIATNTANIAINTASIAAIAAGSGIIVSLNDTTVGVLNGKIIAGENVFLTENNDGGNETLSINSKTTIVAKTEDYTLQTNDLNGLKTFTNEGASGDINFDLLACFTNAEIAFYVAAAHYLKVTANGTEKFRFGSVQSAAGGYLRSNVIGTYFKLKCMGGEWVIAEIREDVNYDK